MRSNKILVYLLALTSLCPHGASAYFSQETGLGKPTEFIGQATFCIGWTAETDMGEIFYAIKHHQDGRAIFEAKDECYTDCITASVGRRIDYYNERNGPNVTRYEERAAVTADGWRIYMIVINPQDALVEVSDFEATKFAACTQLQ